MDTIPGLLLDSDLGLAVDDESEAIRACKVNRARYEGLEQGDVVTARLTRNLACARWIIQVETPPSAG